MATSPRRRAADKSAPAADTAAAANVKPMGVGADGVALPVVSLEMIQAATAAGSFVYLSPEAVLHFGVSIETNPAMQQNDYIAARAAATAVQPNQPQETNPVTETTQTAAAQTTTAAATTFEIVENFQMPTARKPGNGNTKYPFDALNVGAAFFVPAGTVKSLASTVASANARYAEVLKQPDGSAVTRTNRKGKTVEATQQLRTFQVRAGDKNGVAGAYVGRIK